MSNEQTTTELTGQDGAGAVPEVDTENTDTNLNSQNGAGAAPEEQETDDNGAGSDNVPQGAPEVYDFKGLQLPEGFEIDAALAEKFTPIGKELNLSQQNANKLANFLVEFQQEQLASANEKITEYRKQEKEATKLSYEKMLNTDKEIGGGDKAKMNAYLDVADVGYGAFASDELKAILSELHLDYHPAVIKHFHRLGKLCGNDTITKTNAPTGTQQSAAEILYGSKSE